MDACQSKLPDPTMTLSGGYTDNYENTDFLNYVGPLRAVLNDQNIHASFYLLRFGSPEQGAGRPNEGIYRAGSSYGIVTNNLLHKSEPAIGYEFLEDVSEKRKSEMSGSASFLS